jgi:hypothetical protein
MLLRKKSFGCQCGHNILYHFLIIAKLFSTQTASLGAEEVIVQGSKVRTIWRVW